MKTSDQIKNFLELEQPPALVELYGSEVEKLDNQKKRYLNLLHNFITRFPVSGMSLFSSPGRTEIGGNHTDHNHGRVLAGAVNLDNIAIAAQNNTPIIHIVSEGYPEIKVDITSLEIIEAEKYTSAALVRGICSKMKELGFKTGGFYACIDGAVPKGSGLSSSASFEVLIASILSHLFNEGKLDPIENAKIGQFAENLYFGKPCGLMDQTACAVGGLVTIDFQNPGIPKVRQVNFDFKATGYYLVITDTGGNHADLNEEYATLPVEMKSVAQALGAVVLRDTSLGSVLNKLPELRELTGDRALLRAYHFFNENHRVVKQVEALESGNFSEFLQLVIASGYSSYMYNQNIYPVKNIKEQGVSIGLALSEMILNVKGAWRVHGGGFAGTIQAFVPEQLVDKYKQTLEQVFGENSCKMLKIRKQGAIKLNL